MPRVGGHFVAAWLVVGQDDTMLFHDWPELPGEPRAELRGSVGRGRMLGLELFQGILSIGRFEQVVSDASGDGVESAFALLWLADWGCGLAMDSLAA